MNKEQGITIKNEITNVQERLLEIELTPPDLRGNSLSIQRKYRERMSEKAKLEKKLEKLEKRIAVFYRLGLV